MTPAGHNWLFSPGAWEAKGTFWDGGVTERRGSGRSVVRHLEDRWEIAVEVEFETDPLHVIENSYVVTPPPEPGAMVINWYSENTVIGRLEGVYAVTDETIISQFASSDRRHRGSETMTRVAVDNYQVRGIYMCDDEVVFTWSQRLTRER